jgi:hypothetical protein
MSLEADMDPMTTLAAGAIAKIALDEFIKAGSSELAKKTVGDTLELTKSLREKISAKFKGTTKAEEALTQAQQESTPAAIEKVSKYLDLEMEDDQEFAHDVRQLAQQILSIQNQAISSRKYHNYGRDQINIENLHSNQKIGGS